MFFHSFLGIPVIADLPVGENLQDHYGTGALAFTVDQPVTLVQTRYENIPSVLKYAMFGSGPLTVLGGVEGMAWIPTKYENRSKDWPDIEFHFVSGSLGSDGGRLVCFLLIINPILPRKVWLGYPPKTNNCSKDWPDIKFHFVSVRFCKLRNWRIYLEVFIKGIFRQ